MKVQTILLLTATLMLQPIKAEARLFEETKNVTENEFSENYDENLYVLSHVINGEACGCSWEMKIGVGSVVINRVHDDRFPDTITEVVFQEQQYACTWDGNYDREPEDECIEAAEYLLENGSQYPDEVVWQANFIQGDGLYEQIGNMYFCY